MADTFDLGSLYAASSGAWAWSGAWIWSGDQSSVSNTVSQTQWSDILMTVPVSIPLPSAGDFDVQMQNIQPETSPAIETSPILENSQVSETSSDTVWVPISETTENIANPDTQQPSVISVSPIPESALWNLPIVNEIAPNDDQSSVFDASMIVQNDPITQQSSWLFWNQSNDVISWSSMLSQSSSIEGSPATEVISVPDTFSANQSPNMLETPVFWNVSMISSADTSSIAPENKPTMQEPLQLITSQPYQDTSLSSLSAISSNPTATIAETIINPVPAETIINPVSAQSTISSIPVSATPETITSETIAITNTSPVIEQIKSVPNSAPNVVATSPQKPTITNLSQTSAYPEFAGINLTSLIQSATSNVAVVPTVVIEWSKSKKIMIAAWAWLGMIVLMGVWYFVYSSMNNMTPDAPLAADVLAATGTVVSGGVQWDSQPLVAPDIATWDSIVPMWPTWDMLTQWSNNAILIDNKQMADKINDLMKVAMDTAKQMKSQDKSDDARKALVTYVWVKKMLTKLENWEYISNDEVLTQLAIYKWELDQITQ